MDAESVGPQRHDLVIPERDNLRAALAWSLEAGEPELGLELFVSLENYWATSAPEEGVDWAAALLRERAGVDERFVARALGYGNATFEQGDVFDLSRLGEFDVVLLLGVLYHVDSPVELLRRVRAVTRKLLVVDTDAPPVGGHALAPDDGGLSLRGTEHRADHVRSRVWFEPEATAAAPADRIRAGLDALVRT